MILQRLSSTQMKVSANADITDAHNLSPLGIADFMCGRSGAPEEREAVADNPEELTIAWVHTLATTKAVKVLRRPK